jgi:cbb3-type cytochrome oxidase maturation protein
MDTLYLLIPVSALLILAIVAIFGWAVHSGQFEDVEREGERFLEADETGPQVAGEPRSKNEN